MVCREDATEHGRLLALKKILGDITVDKKLEDEHLACLYLKDIATLKCADLGTE